MAEYLKIVGNQDQIDRKIITWCIRCRFSDCLWDKGKQKLDHFEPRKFTSWPLSIKNCDHIILHFCLLVMQSNQRIFFHLFHFREDWNENSGSSLWFAAICDHWRKFYCSEHLHYRWLLWTTNPSLWSKNRNLHSFCLYSCSKWVSFLWCHLQMSDYYISVNCSSTLPSSPQEGSYSRSKFFLSTSDCSGAPDMVIIRFVWCQIKYSGGLSTIKRVHSSRYSRKPIVILRWSSS